MKISDFLKEKWYVFFLAFVVSVVESLFFVASEVNIDTIIFFALLLWIMILIILFYEYLKKYRFYKKLQDNLEKLDNKALVHEMLDAPGFLEGDILYDVLLELDKYINDVTSDQALRERDYKEYIELWVHEIKTPLAAGKLIVENHKSDEMKKIDSQLTRIEDFVEQALFYARSTSVEKDYVIKEINLKDVINTVVKRNKQTFLYKNISVNLHDLDVFVYSDIKWLEFIVHQIVDNALKYTESHGTIEIYSTINKDNVELYIKDNGIGIADSDLARIFERGFTGLTGREYKKATGMGLFLCKLLCDKLYLGIKVDSELNKGTIVTLTLPMNSLMQFK